MKTLTLRRYKGKKPVAVLVDDEDYENVRQYPWSKNYLGYISGKVDGKRVYLHRLIMGYPDGKVVDHINGDKLDNRKQNLRICTVRQNVMNSKTPKNNTSGHTGVSLRSDRKLYRANIMVNRRQIYLGSFERIEDAVLARKQAEVKYFGEFAYAND